MKIKKNFALRTIAGMQVVFPLSEETLNFNGMLTLNESGVMLWKMLEDGCTHDDMVNALTSLRRTVAGSSTSQRACFSHGEGVPEGSSFLAAVHHFF